MTTCADLTFNHECLSTANIYGFSHQTSQFVTQPAWQNLDLRVIMKSLTGWLQDFMLHYCWESGEVARLSNRWEFDHF